MEDLPPQLITEILTRIADSSDLARTRLVSNTFNSLARELRSVHLVYTLSRYLKSRAPDTAQHVTPFKDIIKRLVRSPIDSVSIGVEKSLSGIPFDDVEGEADDLFLTDVNFVGVWLPRVCGELLRLSVSDFWIQSCWRRSDVLKLLSSCCHKLEELELKNAWLSVDGLKPIPSLTSLTLEHIRLDDEDLNNVNHCFPSLQVLNLIGVGGLKEPKIDLSHLRKCNWTVSNAPQSLTILAPNLVKLKLQCISPKSIVLETPLLSDFYLSLEKAYKFELSKGLDLKSLYLGSADLLSLICLFPYDISLKSLTLDSLVCELHKGKTMLSLDSVFTTFPSLSSLSLQSGAYSEVEASLLACDLLNLKGMKGLKEFTAQLSIRDFNHTISFISYILDRCIDVFDMRLFIHHEEKPEVGSALISRCVADYPRVRWRWGMWKEGTSDCWFTETV